MRIIIGDFIKEVELQKVELFPEKYLPTVERIQLTMLCDKKKMLEKSREKIGLKSSKKIIESIFDRGERIRNFVVHPTISPDRDSDLPRSGSVSIEIGFESLSELAEWVTECHELIEDINNAIKN